MYALSQKTRPRGKDCGDEDCPQVPTRYPTTSGADQHHSATKSSDGEVFIEAAHTMQSPQKKHDLEDDEGCSSQDETPTVIRSGKAGMSKPGAAFVGAVAVDGPGASSTVQSFASTANENTYRDSFATRTPQAGQEVPSHSLGQGQPIREEPVEARCVSDDDADIEAQVQSRMRNEARDIAEMVHKQLMTNAAVPVDVQPSLQGTSSPTTEVQDDSANEEQRKKKRICLIAIGVLAIIAAIAVGVGVAVSNKNTDPPSAPTSSPQPQPGPNPKTQVFQELLEPLSGDVLNDVDSPQFKALSWIANDDLASTTVGSTPDETIKARYVAAVIYYALGGQEWPEKYSFLSEGDICTWNQNGAGGFLFGISCSSDGTVESLRLGEFQQTEVVLTYCIYDYAGLLIHFFPSFQLRTSLVGRSHWRLGTCLASRTSTWPTIPSRGLFRTPLRISLVSNFLISLRMT